MMLKTLSVLCLLGASSAFLFGSSPDWNDLKLSWGINYFTHFNSQPRTEDEAVKDGWVKISSCDESATAKWRGNRYIKGNDSVAILIYDKNGYIAGIQGAVPEDKKTGYPKKLVGAPLVEDGGLYYITAYFTNPDIICSTGRTKEHFDSRGTGTQLLIQNGTNPTKDLMEVPLKESDMEGTKWQKGNCFKTMGDHWWYDVGKDSDCEALFPVFVLYNKGSLNAFGWAFVEDLTSSRTEHPGKDTYTYFMQESKIPTCLSAANSQVKLSTMHVYLTSTPLLDWC